LSGTFNKMKTIGIFEAKTRLSEVCEEVAKTHEPITVTKRGKPPVRIDPIDTDILTIRERREAYMEVHGKLEKSSTRDFEPPARAPVISEFQREH